MSLDVLNSSGCGVCTKSEVLDTICLRWWEKLLIKLKLMKPIDTDRVMQVRCLLTKKIKKTTDLCIDYSPRKQIKMFGALKDEEVKFDLKVMRF